MWEESKLPDGKLLIPGVITHGSNFVEHPEAIAQRIGRFAQVVGRENVIAGADCGFASFLDHLRSASHRRVVQAGVTGGRRPPRDEGVVGPGVESRCSRTNLGPAISFENRVWTSRRRIPGVQDMPKLAPLRRRCFSTHAARRVA